MNKDTEIANLREALIHEASEKYCSDCGHNSFDECCGEPEDAHEKDIYMECVHCGVLACVYKHNKGK